MKKFGFLTIIVSILHFIEDAVLVGLGRYTEVNFLILLIGTIVFSALIAWIARMPKVKQWLVTD